MDFLHSMQTDPATKCVGGSPEEAVLLILCASIKEGVSHSCICKTQ